jgi:hypothetical protein
LPARCADGLDLGRLWQRSVRETAGQLEQDGLIPVPIAGSIVYMNARQPLASPTWTSRPRRSVVAGLVALAALAIVAPRAARAQGPQPASAVDARTDRARRRQAAAELHRQGADVDWRLASWEELSDWLARARRARLIHDRFAVDIDWRGYSLAELGDFEGRLVCVGELRSYGIAADWRLYSAVQLRELAALVRKQRASSPATAARSAGVPGAPFAFDPDAVLLPTTVAEELYRSFDDDDVLEPTSLRRRRRAEDRPLPLSSNRR